MSIQREIESKHKRNTKKVTKRDRRNFAEKGKERTKVVEKTPVETDSEDQDESIFMRVPVDQDITTIEKNNDADVTGDCNTVGEENVMETNSLDSLEDTMGDRSEADNDQVDDLEQEDGEPEALRDEEQEGDVSTDEEGKESPPRRSTRVRHRPITLTYDTVGGSPSYAYR